MFVQSALRFRATLAGVRGAVSAVIALGVLACGSHRVDHRAPRAGGQVATAVESGVHSRLEAWVGFLASDALAGRGTPSAGLEVAAEYLASELRRAGWAPGNGTSYRQPWTLAQFDPTQAEVAVSVGDQELRSDEYLVAPFGFNPKLDLHNVPLAVAGYGVFAPEAGFDDYEGLDVSGRAVVVFEGARSNTDPDAIFGFDRALGKQLAAVGHGARLTIYVTSRFGPGASGSPEVAFLEGFSKLPVAYIPELDGATGAFAPVVVLSKSGYDRVLAGSVGCQYDACQALLARGERLRPARLPAATAAIRPRAIESGVASNVVATLPGRSRADEWIVLTAHYDHLGTAPTGDDPIYNGADDNASGTAALLEVARRLAAAGGLERSVMILFTSGEERGLLGSAYYAHAPLVPLDNVVLDINVDMVGRSEGSVEAHVYGSPALFDHIETIGGDRGLNVLPDQNPTWRIAYLTDHYHFLRFGIPAVELFTGLHADYHQPGDDGGKIRYAELAKIAALIYDLAHYYASGDAVPAYERPAWFLVP